mmetsp:Transcript_4373/g.6034  ORF Transcript_4373/g.6034 Transcript_4373/m.6034 type:complete len:264 (-) Transcript_4373:247-1038(-)|eukprot:CAMPEP_0117748868 /NCGR_PEP_ID=MMETSP0947-20121206/9405_1 /TAXON_ID=44440 /ORGANISM="Chattonella subsalsa, Strain CCMP2191" /LENGTH=263 /DNA_ID=CAMNT_0005566679 /DNA_START=63 /DNA_END=854 /DNA_ORIENTATION=-
MGKKKQGVNTKVQAANERKAKQKEEKDQQKAAQNEAKAAAEWSVGSNKRAAQRSQENERKQMEALQKKAEKKRLEEEENASMKSQAKKVKVKKKDIPPWEAALQDVSKKSKAEKAREARQKKLEQERKQKEEAAAAEEERRRRAEKRGEDEEKLESWMAYDDGLEGISPNMNRMQSEHEAVSGLDAILNDMSLDNDPNDKHPERRRKAMFKAYYERMLPEMKEDFPGLKLSQYKQRIFEMWKKSPENPMNQKMKDDENDDNNC